MHIHIGTDHAGFTLKNSLVTFLKKKGYKIFDYGPTTLDKSDDYPKFCIAVAEAVAKEQELRQKALGIVIGGSGNGEQIVANKVKGIRAALVWNVETAVLARQHNDANIISIGARQHTEEEVNDFVLTFIKESFSNEERHIRRIMQIQKYEKDKMEGLTRIELA